ncbi:MAG: GtrA family protein [Oscillospiraceae bacterium]|nr:GtrA family protein [Oscillospiraceae bacterium]
MKALLLKYRQLIAYGFFGCLTTAVNWVVYFLLANVAGVATLPSNAAAWLLSTTFSFFANKLIVFQSVGSSRSRLRMEIATFYGARALTLVLDEALMYLAVDVWGQNGLIWKVIVNVIVIALNYVAMRFISFRKEETKETSNP